MLWPAATRYTDRPFPPYRYIPGGADPHPIRDPAGHSYRAPDAPASVVEHVPPDAWALSSEYLYACDLYNHGYWWEAHETWEGLWRLARRDGAQRHFLQGLIQVAVCHLKLEMGVLSGVRSLRRTSSRHLREAFRRLPTREFMGIDLKAWHDAVQAYYDGVLTRTDGPPMHDPRRYPYLVLPL